MNKSRTLWCMNRERGFIPFFRKKKFIDAFTKPLHARAWFISILMGVTFYKVRGKSKKIIITGLIFFLLFNKTLFSSDEVEEAGTLAKQGEYQKAYEKLLAVINDMRGEIENLQGLVKYYKDELAKLNSPPQVVDYSYNESANSLWASAWDMQHDGVFKKTGKEKEECLHKAVDLYKKIVIDYPYSNKAEEAQYRIGRIYFKFIKNNKLAEVELQRYLNMYPKGVYASDVKEMLDRIKR